MNWLQLTIRTTQKGIDEVCAILYALGINGLQIESEEDFNDFLANNEQYWDYVDEELAESKKGVCFVRLYLADNIEAPEMISAIKSSLLQLKDDPLMNLGSLEVSIEGVNEEDWANNWKQYYKPIEIGNTILIKPQWESTPQTDRKILNINPGMAFGTGSHHSTQLCMLLLEKYVQNGMRVADLGCGSGILSIAALLLGASTAVGVDIDPEAARIARENAALNDFLGERFTSFYGNVISDLKILEKLTQKPFDIVVANIVADVIIALLNVVPKMLKKDGIFITSGIIDERKDEVISKMKEHGFQIIDVQEASGWCAICAK